MRERLARKNDWRSRNGLRFDPSNGYSAYALLGRRFNSLSPESRRLTALPAPELARDLSHDASCSLQRINSVRNSKRPPDPCILGIGARSGNERPNVFRLAPFRCLVN